MADKVSYFLGRRRRIGAPLPACYIVWHPNGLITFEGIDPVHGPSEVERRALLAQFQNPVTALDAPPAAPPAGYAIVDAMVTFAPGTEQHFRVTCHTLHHPFMLSGHPPKG